VLFAAVGFSAKAVLIKLAYQYGAHVDAITLMMLRMIMALPFFLLVAFWNNKRVAGQQKIHFKEGISVLVLGVMGYYLASLFDFKGLQLISAGLERVILFLFPTFVLLFSAIFQRRKVSRFEMLALGLSYAGTFVVYIENINLNSQQVLLGSGLVLASAITFACFLMGSGVMIVKLGSVRFTAYSMSVACVATGVHFAVEHGFKRLEIPADVYILALLMAVFSTVLPAFFMNAGIRKIGASRAAVISSVGPIGTLIMAYAFLGEAITIAQIAGTLLVLVGVYFVSRNKAQR
jgi:drug/metabolite transporter (DMT)-like permease